MDSAGSADPAGDVAAAAVIQRMIARQRPIAGMRRRPGYIPAFFFCFIVFTDYSFVLLLKFDRQGNITVHQDKIDRRCAVFHLIAGEFLSLRHLCFKHIQIHIGIT